jgi:GntR family transcriptional repressor for pyruvate dehydrogenase complex
MDQLIEFAPIKRKSLVESVTEKLRHLILSGKLKSGETLPPEGNLAKMFFVSRTVIREAMRNLRSQGLVEVSQGHSPRVKSADPREAIDTLDVLLQRGNGTNEDLIEVRLAVECEIVATAAKRRTLEDISRLEETLTKMNAVNSLDEMIEMDVLFHKYLAQCTQNRIFVLLIETLSGLLRDAQRKSYNKKGLHSSYDNHFSILKAVKNSDSQAAKRAMMEHLEALNATVICEKKENEKES